MSITVNPIAFVKARRVAVPYVRALDACYGAR